MTQLTTRQIETTASDVGKRLDVFLSETEADLTRSHIQKLLQDGMISVNGTAAYIWDLLENDTDIDTVAAALCGFFIVSVIDVEVTQISTVEIELLQAVAVE